MLLVVIIAGISGSGSGSSASSAPPTIDVTAGDTTLTVPVSTLPNVVVESTDQTLTKTTLAGPISSGSYSDDVRQVQQRLKDLGFAPGPIDGIYGTGTQQAVWAYKKLVGGLTYDQLAANINRSTVSNELWQLMQDPIVIQPRRPQGTGTHVEIYLPLQVLAVFTDDKPTLIAHISSGELDENGQPKQWCDTTIYDTDNEGRPLDPPVERQECAYAKTPGGMFTFRRQVLGTRTGPLGGMFNPVYFNYGLAVHGAKNVPKEPASHGCVRINMDIAEYFPSLVHIRDRVYVWGHDGKEPEAYTKRESTPSFNAPDPNATTTTSTTIKPTTTLPDATVKPVTPTTKPVTTTTIKPISTTTTTTTTTTPTTTTTTTSAPAP